MQFGFAKRIDEVLEHYRFVGAVEHLGATVRLRAWGEEGGVVGGEFVADMHHAVARLAKGFGSSVRRSIGSGLGADLSAIALGEVVVLDIDYDERLFGHEGFLDQIGCEASIGFGRRFEEIGRNDNKRGKLTMTQRGAVAELGVLIYPGAQLAAVHGLT